MCTFFNIELLLWPLLLRLKQTLLLKLKESLVTMAYVMKSSVLKHGVCGHTSTLQDAHYFGKIPTQMLIGTQPTQADIRQGSLCCSPSPGRCHSPHRSDP